MEIINGRIVGDAEGEATFINKNGHSVTDLCLVAGQLKEEIVDMKLGTGF